MESASARGSPPGVGRRAVDCEVEVNGRLRRIGITQDGRRWSVEIDGRVWQVDAVRVGAHTWSLLVPGTPEDDGGASYEISVTPAAVGSFAVRVGAATVAAAVNGGRRVRNQRRDAGNGPQRLTAPMPGKVVRVLVAPGDVVQTRQALVVIEAMKMENELRADRPGTVARVHVGAGASVDAGAPLVEIQ